MSGLSVNKLMEELSTIALVQHETEVRFRGMASRGSRKTCLALARQVGSFFLPKPKR